MRRYEITERGKILISVILVLLILIAAVILMILSGKTSENSPGAKNTGAVYEPPDITTEPVSTESPQSDKQPINTTPLIPGSPSENGAQEEPPAGTDSGNSGAPPEYAEETQPDSGTDSPSLEGGTLSFPFSPGLQTKLADDTERLLDDFFNSIDYLQNYMIVVETPKLSQEDKEAVLSAVMSALEKYEISENRLDHVTLPSAAPAENGVIMVKLYYVSLLVK